MSIELGADELALAFELSALERLADPDAVFADARRWSRFVGILSNDAEALEAFVRERDLEPDFDREGRDLWLAATEVKTEHPAGRYVLVGTGREARRVADHVGWEFVRLEEAAEKAEWALESDGGDGSGFVGRLRAHLSGGAQWPFRR